MPACFSSVIALGLPRLDLALVELDPGPEDDRRERRDGAGLPQQA
jgi:hypothetical protein